MIQLHDLTFAPFISEAEINRAVEKIAKAVRVDFQNETPVFLGILDGAFMFAAHLVKNYRGNCAVSFIKVKSYIGTHSGGKVSELIGMENLAGKPVVVVEDIVDTGNTIEAIVERLRKEKVTRYKIATLFLKPDAYKKSLPIDYVGIKIPDKFIVGYGLDYNGLGRNLPEVYQLKKQK